jgi:hypothetical protein
MHTDSTPNQYAAMIGAKLSNAILNLPVSSVILWNGHLIVRLYYCDTVCKVVDSGLSQLYILQEEGKER